jgi:DNA-binding phage protein
MNNTEASEYKLLESLRELNVPFQKSVSLLCSVKNIPLRNITDAAGYNRNSLYKALKDQRRPKYELYQSVIDHLGVDP